MPILNGKQWACPTLFPFLEKEADLLFSALQLYICQNIEKYLKYLCKKMYLPKFEMEHLFLI